MKNLSFLYKNWFLISLLFLAILAALLRFSNYNNRFVLGGDQAHFALEARYALESFQLPFLGPFSSAGPFQTGGEWYWFVMIGSIWNMSWVLAPWVFLTTTYVLFVVGMSYLGKKLEDKTFGIIVGLLCAVSTKEISQSVNLSNQSPISLLALAALFSMLFYIEKKQVRYFFLISLMIGIASSIHFQGVALLPLLIFTYIIQFPGVKGTLLAPLGILLPWLPVFYIDSKNHFTNINNMIYYYFFEKNKVSFDVLGRNWKNFIGIFIPDAWAGIIGGYIITGYIFFIVSFVWGIYEGWQKKLKKEWLIIFLTLPGMLIILRYTRTPLFDSFYVFLHPFILLISSWVIFQIYKKRKEIGILVLVCVCIGSLLRDITEINSHGINVNAIRAEKQANFLIKHYPNKKFAIYDYKFDTSAFSQALVLYLDTQNKIDENGMKIGFINASEKSKFEPYILPNYFDDYPLVDFSKMPLDIQKMKWVDVTPRGIYNSGQFWYQNK